MPHCPVVFSKAPLALAALCCFANPAAAQPPRIRVDVDLVRVPFVATDSNGKPIRDLRLAAGAGYIYALAGEISTMPGLPHDPGFVLKHRAISGRPVSCLKTEPPP